MSFYCKLCWVVEQLWSLKYERKSQFKGFLKKDVIPEEIKKEKRRSEKKRKKENTNDFKLTWKKCFYTWKLKQTQNKICHESQWSTRMIGHCGHTIVHWSPSWRTEDIVITSRSKQVLSGLHQSLRTGDAIIASRIIYLETRVLLFIKGQCIKYLNIISSL